MKRRVTTGIFAAVFMTGCFIIAHPQKTQAAQAVAISSADDFLKIEDNPSGSYYLTKDITVPANTSLFTKWDKQFKGTLDGKGHKIKGYTYSAGVYTDYASLFVYAKNATFKNLTLSNVNISLKKSGKASALAAYPIKCTFSNITVSGKITVSGTTSSASGVVALANGKCTFTKCVNKADITVNAYDTTNSEDADSVDDQGGDANGIAGLAYDSTAMKCSNSGKITINGDLRWASEKISAIGLFGSIKGITGSKNTGTITAKNVSKGDYASGGVLAVGIAGEVYGAGKKMVSCYNTGKISASNNSNDVGTVAAGIVNAASKTDTRIMRCYNTGAVQISGVAGGKTGIESGAGGIGGLNVASITESYNTGKIAANVKTGGVKVGGIAADICNVRNCYNTGSVSTKTNAVSYIGGIAGWQEAYARGREKEAAACNYNIGIVKGGKKVVKGAIIGRYEVAGIVGKAAVYDNYYKSGKAYGEAGISWKPYLAKAVKVSSIKTKSCPKLSSKYWVYSSKHKRLILKNNKEK